MKQVNTIIKSSLLLFFLLQVISCKKFLDKKSSTGLSTIDRLQDLQALLDNVETINGKISPLECEAASDNYFTFQPVGDNGRLFYTWQYFIITYNNENAWLTNYFSVNIANICLEEIENFSKTGDNAIQWNTIKGSALFLRAYCFLNLSWVYAKTYDSVTSASDLGIALRLGIDKHVPTVRASVSQSYDQLISDAKESIAYLPDIAPHPLRPSKAAAYGLLARAYLSMRIYDSAFKYADLSLQIRSELMDYNGDADIGRPLNDAASPFRQYNKETIFYAKGESGLSYQILNEASIDTVLYNSYHVNDLRKIAFYMPDGKGYQKFKGNYTQTIDQRFGGIATDEMFLIRAECYARKEMVTEAMDDLNTLMIKRWKNTVPYPVITATDPTDALQKILTERRKELVFRSIRWSDIKRLNKEDAAIVLKRIVEGEPYELLPNSDKYALPIPDDIIRLAGIPQNPGWL